MYTHPKSNTKIKCVEGNDDVSLRVKNMHLCNQKEAPCSLDACLEYPSFSTRSMSSLGWTARGTVIVNAVNSVPPNSSVSLAVLLPGNVWIIWIASLSAAGVVAAARCLALFGVVKMNRTPLHLAGESQVPHGQSRSNW